MLSVKERKESNKSYYKTAGCKNATKENMERFLALREFLNMRKDCHSSYYKCV